MCAKPMTSKALFFTRLSFKYLLKGRHKHRYLRTSSKRASNTARCSVQPDLQVSTSSRLLAISEALPFELIHCLLFECKYCLLVIVTIVPSGIWLVRGLSVDGNDEKVQTIWTSHLTHSAESSRRGIYISTYYACTSTGRLGWIVAFV